MRTELKFRQLSLENDDVEFFRIVKKIKNFQSNQNHRSHEIKNNSSTHTRNGRIYIKLIENKTKM